MPSVLGTIAHALGANGYVQTSSGTRFSFSNSSEGIYRFKGTVIVPPGPTGKPKEVYFTNPYSAMIAATATATPGTRVVETKPGP